MGLAEAKKFMLENPHCMRVIPSRGKAWRTTLAGTNWVLISLGYSEGSRENNTLLRYELHVHGNKQFRVTETSHDAKVCGENLRGGQAFLSTDEWRRVSTRVKDLIRHAGG